MSLIDRILARNTVMFTSPLSVEECRARIGPGSPSTPFGTGTNGVSDFIVAWRGDDEVVLSRPWSRFSRKRAPRATLRARFERQSNGTFVDVTTGMMPSMVACYAATWLFFGSFLLLNLQSVLHATGGNPAFGVFFCGFAMPLIYIGARFAVVRQSGPLVSQLEILLAQTLDSAAV